MTSCGARPTPIPKYALWGEIHQEWLTGAHRIVEIVKAAGGLTDRLSTDQAADIVTVYNGPGLHHHLTRVRGCSQEGVQDLLGGALRHELLA